MASAHTLQRDDVAAASVAGASGNGPRGLDAAFPLMRQCARLRTAARFQRTIGVKDAIRMRISIRGATWSRMSPP